MLGGKRAAGTGIGPQVGPVFGPLTGGIDGSRRFVFAEACFRSVVRSPPSANRRRSPVDFRGGRQESNVSLGTLAALPEHEYGGCNCSNLLPSLHAFKPPARFIQISNKMFCVSLHVAC